MRLKIYLTAFKKMTYCNEALQKFSLLKNFKLYFSIFSFSHGLTHYGNTLLYIADKALFSGLYFFIFTFILGHFVIIYMKNQ